MRILYHHRTLGDGAEGIHIREMIEAFRGLGHEVRVVSLIGEQTNRPTTRKKRWHAVSRLLPGGLYELAELGYNVVGGRRIEQAAREFQPDFIYDRYNSYNTAALRAGAACDVPVMLEVNAPVAFERTAYENLQLRFPSLARRYERHICNAADHVLVVSTPLKRHLVEQLGVDPGHITVLPNGANPDSFRTDVDGSEVRARHGLDSAVVVGFVGILRPWHGVDLLIEAVARLRDKHPALRLLIVGDGPIEADLKRLALQRGLADAAAFTGRIAHADIPSHVAAMDVAVSPRATFYASPMKVLEYMALAKPTVAPAMDNLRDLIADGEDGLLFEPESVDSLAMQLDMLIGNAELRSRIGAAARRRIETERNWTAIARQVTDLAGNLAQRG